MLAREDEAAYLAFNTVSWPNPAMNRFERIPLASGEAQLRFLDGDYRIVRPGSFVRCAVTGEPIPLDELKYWSVELQEAYSGPEAVLARLDSQPRKR